SPPPFAGPIVLAHDGWVGLTSGVAGCPSCLDPAVGLNELPAASRACTRLAASMGASGRSPPSWQPQCGLLVVAADEAQPLVPPMAWSVPGLPAGRRRADWRLGLRGVVWWGERGRVRRSLSGGARGLDVLPARSDQKGMSSVPEGAGSLGSRWRYSS